jgi:hypothetical protein
MRLAIIVFTIIVSTIFAFEFSLGVFEYQTGPRGFAKFEQEIDVGKFSLGIRHWIFFRAYDFGFYDFPHRITPFNWESSGGWWDVYVKFYLTPDMWIYFLHRSEHNFDGLHFLNIHWYNFFGFAYIF